MLKIAGSENLLHLMRNIILHSWWWGDDWSQGYLKNWTPAFLFVQNRFFITSLRAEYSARMIDFFIKMEVKILLLFCKLFCKQLTQNDSFRLILPYHLYIASELAKRDITLLVSWPKETANSHCNVISHVLGGRPCPRRCFKARSCSDCCSRRKEKERRSFHVEDWAPIGSLGGREASQKKSG